MPRSRLEIAVKNIEFARNYTLGMIDDLNEADWFRQPSEGVTHIAWQIGHLTMAEYALTMLRIRGKEPEDSDTISNNFFRKFQKGTTPNPDASFYPSVDEIRSTFNAVHSQALKELATYSDQELDVSLPEPHAVFETKLGSVFFCSSHEMLHAGQIGMLRRLMGKTPLR